MERTDPFSDVEQVVEIIEYPTIIWVDDEEGQEPLGAVKWFRDQLGHNWVKFDVEGNEGIVTLVFPHDAVKCVEYHK